MFCSCLGCAPRLRWQAWNYNTGPDTAWFSSGGMSTRNIVNKISIPPCVSPTISAHRLPRQYVSQQLCNWTLRTEYSGDDLPTTENGLENDTYQQPSHLPHQVSKMRFYPKRPPPEGPRPVCQHRKNPEMSRKPTHQGTDQRPPSAEELSSTT